MSRVAKNPIEIVDGVTINVTDSSIEVKGKVGEIKFDLPETVSLEVSENIINVKYIYHLLLSNQKYIETYMQKGSSNRTLHCARIDHLILTIPPIDEQNKYVKEINQREEEYERKKNELLQYKQDTDNIISEMFPINLI